MAKGSVWALLSAALDKGFGPRWRVQSLAQYPRSDYLRGLNSIVHANFITTTLAPMGEHQLREPERWAARRWKGRSKTKGVWVGPPFRAEVAKGGYFALKRMFEFYRRVVKWRAHPRLLTGDRRVARRGLLREPLYGEGRPLGHYICCHRDWKSWPFKINSRIEDLSVRIRQ